MEGAGNEEGDWGEEGFALLEGSRREGAPLGCSCQDSREADIIHLISSYRLKVKQQNPRGVFPAKLGQSYTKFPLSQLCRCIFLSAIKQITNHYHKFWLFSFGVRNLKPSDNITFEIEKFKVTASHGPLTDLHNHH